MPRKKAPESKPVRSRLQKALGLRLQIARRNTASGRTNQAELADALGVTRTSISNIERGQHRVFLDQVYLAARALGVDLVELLPTLAEVFPDDGVSMAPDTDLNENSLQDLRAIVHDLQRRVSEEGLAINPVRRDHRKTTQRR